jgi:hypothetical protein
VEQLRRVVSRAVIACFSVAALLGVVALLSGGDFGGTEVRVLLTTVVLGAESVAMLCYLALAGHRLALVGWVGAPLSLLTTALALAMTWEHQLDDNGIEWFGVLLTLSASLAQASLLLALAARRRTTPGVLLTLLAVAVVAGMVIAAIVDDDRGDGYWRLLGIAAILDVLGTVVVTATRVFGRSSDAETTSPLLSGTTQSRLVGAAAERGTSPDQLVNDALDAYLT